MNDRTLLTLAEHGLPLARLAFRISCERASFSFIGGYLGVSAEIAESLIEAGREVAQVETGTGGMLHD